MSLSIFILTLLSAEACSGLHFSAVIIAKLSFSLQLTKRFQ